MARKREQGSTRPFSGLGLKPSEDKVLVSILAKKEISYKKVARMLFRQWIDENK